MSRPPDKPFLIVLGMHRSGTSLLARMCNLLGAETGPDLMPPGPDNPSGFWEHRRIVELNEDILGTAGLAWNDPFALPAGWLSRPETRRLETELRQVLEADFAKSGLPMLKDPRICRLLPLWAPLLESLGYQPRYLIVSRNPLDVERSLASRNGLPPARSYLLWLRYMLEAEKATRDQPRAFLDYERLLAQWQDTLEPAWGALGLDWPDDPAIAEAIERFADPDLRHHATPTVELNERPYLARFLGQAYDAFRSAEAGPSVDEAGSQAQFDRLRAELEDILFLFDPVLDDLRQRGSGLAEGARDREREAHSLAEARLEENRRVETILQETCAERDTVRKAHEQVHQEIRELERRLDREIQARDAEIQARDAEIQARDAEIALITRSRSWRLTAPLRAVTQRWHNRPRLLQRHTLQRLPRAWRLLRSEGIRSFLRRVRNHTGLQSTPPEPIEYARLPTEFPVLDFPEVAHPDVSVVIPAYNQFAYTYNCLRALLNHSSTYPFEVIVVDDASSDHTASRLQGYGHLRVIQKAENQGFIRSCNEGARHARGEFLVFLNNDTQVQEGWLDALVETFARNPDAGAVGSRLIYPDGRLQEAGGIVWNDGSGWNLGRLDDPNRPEYSYLRVVDYCSAASLAIRGTLFEQLGGFDEYFLPAYYEDTDLCFRVRAAGFRVYYQPHSRVVHFEGITSGTDADDRGAVKHHQVVNQERFAERWRDDLKRHRPPGERPDLEKERDAGRRALVVDACMLTPDQDSGSLRMFNLVRILRTLGYKVTFAPLNLERRQPYTGELQKRGIECLYTPYQRSVRRHLMERGEQYDLVVLSRADVADALMEDARRACPKARIVFDTVDLHFLREQREAALRDDAALRSHAQQRQAQETALIRAADTTFVVSDAEKTILDQDLPGQDIHVVSNIHDIPGRRRGFDERMGILFVGGFAHPPNIDAVDFLADEIAPRVRQRLPDVTFHVIGSNPPASVLAHNGDALRVHGFVEDLEPWLDQVRMTIAPLRYGAGVKGKINMSLSYGVPVVGTTIAIEGMHLQNEESVLVADDADAFAAAICRLYSDPALWLRLSDNGIEIMHRHFSLEAATRDISEALQTATQAGTDSTRP